MELKVAGNQKAKMKRASGFSGMPFSYEYSSCIGQLFDDPVREAMLLNRKGEAGSMSLITINCFDLIKMFASSKRFITGQ